MYVTVHACNTLTFLLEHYDSILICLSLGDDWKNESSYNNNCASMFKSNSVLALVKFFIN